MDRGPFPINPETFNDPWDCKPYFNSDFVSDPAEVEKHTDSYAAITRRHRRDISEEFIAQRQKEFRDNPKFLAERVEKISQGIGSEIAERYRVFCLGPDSGNLLMWSHYADSHRGICLEFSTQNEVMCCAQQVEYRGEFPVLPLYSDSQDDSLVPLLTKSDVWTYESEYRLVVAQDKSNRTPHDTLVADKNYLKLPEGTLTSIIVGCQGPVEEVRKLVKEFAPHVPVRQAARVLNRYAVKIA